MFWLIHYSLAFQKDILRNIEDPDQMAQNTMSDEGLKC